MKEGGILNLSGENSVNVASEGWEKKPDGYALLLRYGSHMI